MPEPPFEFDVFLSHNSRDKPAIIAIARILKNEYNLKPWLDRWQLVAGKNFQPELGKAIDQSQTVAVFIGAAGTGAWEAPEVQKALNIHAKDPSRRVIPVLLPGAPNTAKSELPEFLDLITWVDLSNGYESKDLLYELYCGIKGISPGDSGDDPRKLPTSGVGGSVAVGSQTPASSPRSVNINEGTGATVQVASNQSGEVSQQKVSSAPRREIFNLPTEEELKISRRQLAHLNEAQHTLKDFVNGSIVFDEAWSDCDQAKSKLRDQLENPTEDMSGFRYWNDLKELLKHAKTKIDEETASFLQSKSEFVQFIEALDSALELIETVQLKTGKSKKMDVINKAHSHLQNAVMKARAIVEICQDGAKDKLKDIGAVIQNIFEAEQAPNEGASARRQVSYRPIDRSQISEDLGKSVGLPSKPDGYPS